MEHDIALLNPTLVACVSASSGQKSPDTTRHALDQGPDPSWPNCSPRLAESIALFGYSGRGSSMPRIQTDIWSQTCSIGFMSGLRAGQSMTSTSCWSQTAAVSRLYGVGHCLGRTQSSVQTPLSPMATFDSSGSGCTDAGSWLHAPLPAHSSPHGGLHPVPWLTGHDFDHQAGRSHQSSSPLAFGAPRPDRHCGIGRTGTHHWRYSVSIVWGPTLCASSPIHGSVACDPKWTLGVWLDDETNIRRPETVSEWFELTPASQIGGSPAFADEEPRWSSSFWPFGAVYGLSWPGDFNRTSTLPLMWSASFSVVSQNFSYASLKHSQHPG